MAALKSYSLLAVMLFALTLRAQNRPLTVDVCRNEAKDLYVEVRHHAKTSEEQSYFVWSLRAEEMSKCQDIDPVINGDLPSIQRGIMYINLENVARVAMIGKLNNFIHRHGLEKQFVDDDDSGLQ